MNPYRILPHLAVLPLLAQAPETPLARAQSLAARGFLADALPLAREAAKSLTEGPAIAAELLVLDLIPQLGSTKEAAPHLARLEALVKGSKDPRWRAEWLLKKGRIDRGEGRGADALKSYEEALACFQALGDRIGEARAMEGLGTLHLFAQRYKQAKEQLSAALARTEGLPEDRHTIRIRKRLAETQQQMGDLEPAQKGFERILAYLKDHEDRSVEGDVQMNLAALHGMRGKTDLQDAGLQRALDLAQEIRLLPLELHVMSMRARIAFDRARYAQAQTACEQLFARAREVGAEELQSNALDLMGGIALRQGRFAQAVERFQQALALDEKIGSKSRMAIRYNNLGVTYFQMEELEKSEGFYRKALATHRETGNRTEEGLALGNLAVNLHNLKKLDEAWKAYEEALVVIRATGAKASEAITLMSMGTICMEKKNFQEAQDRYTQSLAILESLEDRAAVAACSHLMGRNLTRLGQDAQAAACLQRAIDIRKELLLRSQLYESLRALAALLPRMGRASESLPLFQAMTTLEAEQLEATFPVLSEREKVRYARNFKKNHHSFMSFVRAYMAKDEKGLGAAFDAWLAHKGTVLETQGRIQAAILGSKDPTVQAKAKDLQELRIKLARAFQSRPQPGKREAYEQQLKELQTQKEALEVDLARLSRAWSTERDARRTDAKLLSERLPKGAAFVDFARIQAFDFHTQEFGEARFLAWVYRPDQLRPLQLLDLGEAQSLEAQVQALHDTLQSGDSVTAALKALGGRVLDPLAQALRGARRVVLSPDGALNLVPFELLPLGGKALMDRAQVSYLTSAQDLVRCAQPPTTSREVAILADPDFGALAAAGPEGTRSNRGLRFAALPATAQEAETVAACFPQGQAKVFQGAWASEATLRSLRAPRILHIATHGYFLGQQEILTRGDGLQAPTPSELKGVENPMLRSGLALAKANAAAQQGQEEGLMCAEKLLDLDLQGTELVVLSACNTGVGKVMDGEGVFGLKRALIQAGARSLLVSLWPVPDTATRDLMTAFYQQIAKGSPKAQALAEAKRSVARRHPHPRNWAAFILVGATD